MDNYYDESPIDYPVLDYFARQHMHNRDLPRAQRKVLDNFVDKGIFYRPFKDKEYELVRMIREGWTRRAPETIQFAAFITASELIEACNESQTLVLVEGESVRQEVWINKRNAGHSYCQIGNGVELIPIRVLRQSLLSSGVFLQVNRRSIAIQAVETQNKPVTRFRRYTMEGEEVERPPEQPE